MVCTDFSTLAQSFSYLKPTSKPILNFETRKPTYDVTKQKLSQRAIRIANETRVSFVQIKGLTRLLALSASGPIKMNDRL